MKLHYRGAVYESAEAPAEMVQGEMIGRYRGVTSRSKQPRRIAASQQSLRVKYRGAWAQ